MFNSTAYSPRHFDFKADYTILVQNNLLLCTKRQDCSRKMYDVAFRLHPKEEKPPSVDGDPSYAMLAVNKLV